MFGFFNRKEYPEFYFKYLNEIKNGFSNEIISIDMETTGIEIKGSEIISFGAVCLNDKKILIKDEIHLHFISDHYDKENIKIHEILPNSGSTSIEKELPVILERIGNRKILGHYVEFDVALMNHQLKKMNLPKLKNPQIDTLKLALRYDGVHDLSRVRKEDYSLYALCSRFDIPVEKTHDAIEDAYLTALLYLHLKGKN